MRNLKIAAQVYSVREEAERDLKGTLKSLKEMGYDGVEFAGLYDHAAVDIRKLMDSIGLVSPSAHVPITAFEKDMIDTIKAYRVLGCRYIGIPSLPREAFYGGEKHEETMQTLRLISDKLKVWNQILMYHNHSFEFEKTDKGNYLLDNFYATLSPDEIKTEFDTCWIKVAGEDPVAYLKAYAGRCPVVHMKDFKREADKVVLVALGDGEMDIQAVADQAIRSGTDWLVIEQDNHTYGSPMENMAKSLDYLRKL